MESTLVTQVPSIETTPTTPVVEEITQEEVKVIYPWARHVILVVLVILAIVIILSLIYLNGKSIYQYGV